MAIHLAAANPGKIAALVVENTFTSIEDVAPKVKLAEVLACPVLICNFQFTRPPVNLALLYADAPDCFHLSRLYV